MNNKIKTTIVPLEVEYENVLLKGELEFWSKEYTVKLLEPFKAESSYHLIYMAPVKYVFIKSLKTTCHEIELKEKSKEILKSIYLNKINNGGSEL